MTVEEKYFDCYECYMKSAKDMDWQERLYHMRMYLCKTCGNKRCPKATCHDLECTNSNEPNQPGSRYSDSYAEEYEKRNP